MSEPEPSLAASTPSAEAAKPAKKRSTMERAAVWAGIVVLLLVVFMEWRSLQGYQTTMNQLDEVLASGKTIPVANLPQYISGDASQTEGERKGEKTVTLHWPSLFKTYKLYLPIERNNAISSFEPADAASVPPVRAVDYNNPGPSLSDKDKATNEEAAKPGEKSAE